MKKPIAWHSYKNFTADKFNCQCNKCRSEVGSENMDVRVIDELQRIRDLIGAAMIVSSGYRCKEHPREKNKQKGAGSHNRGVSVDIKCNAQHAYNILQAASAGGIFQRIGVAQKGGMSGRFLHLQILDETQPECWLFSY